VTEFNELLNKSSNWINSYHEEKINEFNSLFENIKRDKRIIDKAKSRNTAIGLYGESQVGKSYLVSTLLSDNGKELLVSGGHDNDTTMDFIKDLNPKRLSEATALVSRFTINDNNVFIPNYMQIEILSLFDLINSIHLGFFIEIETEQIKDQFLKDKNNYLNNIFNGQDTQIISDQLQHEFLEEYRYYLDISDHFSIDLKKIGKKVLNKIGNNPLSIESMAKAASIFWYGNKSITEYFIELFNRWMKLSNKRCYIHSSLVKNALDMDYFKDWAENKTTREKKSCSINFNGDYYLIDDDGEDSFDLAYIQLLSKEIQLLVNNPSSILTKVDALDFPGIKPNISATERINKKDLNDNKINRQYLADILKNGKLRHLFISYTNKKDITYLLVCIAGENDEPTQLPQHIFKWIEHKAEHSIEKVNQTLFTVMTKSDIVLKDNLSLEDAQKRWETRFGRHFESKFKQCIDLLKSNDIDYNNLFFIRNPNASQIKFDKTDLNNFKESFIQHPLAGKYITDNIKMWDELISKSGGVDYLKKIIDSTLITLPNEKEHYLNQELISKCYKMLEDIMGIHYQPINELEQKQKNIDLANEFISEFKQNLVNNIFNFMFRIESNYPSFGKFEIIEDTDFVPLSYKEKVNNYKYQILKSFKSNLMDSMQDFEKNLPNISRSNLSKFIDVTFTYLMSKDEILNEHLYINEMIYQNFDRNSLKVLHESIKFIIVNWFQNLGANAIIKEVNLSEEISNNYQYNNFINHWETNLPAIYAGDKVEINIQASKELKNILDAIKNKITILEG